jgi:hypothetical protein
MARQREQDGDVDGAAEILESALASAGLDEVDRAAVELGAFYLRRNERDKARTAYAAAVTRAPESARLSRYRLAWLEALESGATTPPVPSPRATLPAAARLGDNPARPARD